MSEVRDGRLVRLVQRGGKRDLADDTISLGVTQLGVHILQPRSDCGVRILQLCGRCAGRGPVVLAHGGNRTHSFLEAHGRDGRRSPARHGLHAAPLRPVPVQAAPASHDAQPDRARRGCPFGVRKSAKLGASSLDFPCKFGLQRGGKTKWRKRDFRLCYGLTDSRFTRLQTFRQLADVPPRRARWLQGPANPQSARTRGGTLSHR